jgi:hypothetical protein
MDPRVRERVRDRLPNRAHEIMAEHSRDLLQMHRKTDTQKAQYVSSSRNTRPHGNRRRCSADQPAELTINYVDDFEPGEWKRRVINSQTRTD